MTKRLLILTDDSVRLRAMEAIRDAPQGYAVRIGPADRSTMQNSMQWPILQCFSDQLLWPVNGEMVKMEPEEWKDVLTAAFRQETVRLAQGLNGGVVMLGARTSKFSKAEFSEWIEFLLATAALKGIKTNM